MTLKETVTIHLATDADMDAVAAIFAHHVLHGVVSFETAPPDPSELHRRRAGVLLQRNLGDGAETPPER